MSNSRPAHRDSLRQLPGDQSNTPGPVPKVRTSLSSHPDPQVRSSTPVLSNKIPFPTLTSYSLESLQASLKRNEAVLNNSRAIKSLPDGGKKLIESNDMLQEAIRIKLEAKAAAKVQTRPRGASVGSSKARPSGARSPDPQTAPHRPSPLSKETHPPRKADPQWSSRLRNRALSASSLTSSSGGSSSGHPSLSSVFSDRQPSSDDLSPPPCLPPPPKMDPLLRSLSIEFRGRDMPLKVAVQLREEEARIQKENTIRYQIHQSRLRYPDPPSAASRYTPYFDFAEDDSDDIDGFSADEYY